MPFLVLRHIDTHHVVLIVKQELRQGFSQLGFTYAGGAQEDERTDGPLWVLQTRPTAAHRVRQGLNGLVLPGHALAQFFLEIKQLLTVAL